MQYFRNGNAYAILYSDDPAGEISLNGVVPNTTTSVTINGYTLQEYSAGSTAFVYKISTALGTIKDGNSIAPKKLLSEKLPNKKKSQKSKHSKTICITMRIMSLFH